MARRVIITSTFKMNTITILPLSALQAPSIRYSAQHPPHFFPWRIEDVTRMSFSNFSTTNLVCILCWSQRYISARTPNICYCGRRLTRALLPVLRYPPVLMWAWYFQPAFLWGIFVFCFAVVNYSCNEHLTLIKTNYLHFTILIAIFLKIIKKLKALRYFN